MIDAGLSVPSDPAKSIKRWLDEVELYERKTQTWEKRGHKIVKRYRDERETKDAARKFNMLWSNTETMRPALYARNPKPDIQRRFKDADPVGRIASDVLERAATYFVDTDHFAGAMRNVVMDYLLPGRGTTWARYVPHMKPSVEVTDDVADGDHDEDRPEIIESEEVALDYIHWTDFGHNICRTWDEVWLVWRKVYLDRDELKTRFGKELGAKIPLDYQDKSKEGGETDSDFAKATIYEAWDKKRGCAVWLHKQVPEYLDLRADPLEIEHFFPCPKPVAANLANDSLIPVPIYVEYQDQADELDTLTARIASITKSLKVAGVRDTSAQGLDRLLSEGVENELIPVDSWAVFAQKGGIDGAIDLLPMKEIAETLLAIYEARDKVKQDLYEITGIADIIRGQSDPNETMGAQKIKSNFATLRLGDQQKMIQAFVREIIRILVDIIGGHFQQETIEQISGVRLLTAQQKQAYQQIAQAGQKPPLPPNVSPDQFGQMMSDPTWDEVMALIRNATARSFRIDIETDSTIKADEVQEKADRIEFLKTVGGFMEQAVQASEQQPALAPLAGQMLMFGVRAFPIGKELEGTINTTIQKLEKMAQAAEGKPKPNPEMIKVQGELQLQGQKQQAEQQAAQAKAQAEIQIQHAKVQADAQIAQQQQAAQAQQAAQENALEAQREQAKMQMEERLAMQKIAAETDLQLKIAHIKAAASIEVARITAKYSDGGEAETREASGE